MNNCAFVLPIGMTLGGVTSWSVAMAQRLISQRVSAVIIEHTSWESPIDLSKSSEVNVISCPGKPAWNATIDDLVTYLPTYFSTLPATIIPNWSSDTYATCALLSLTQANNMRVIGVAHTDEDYYYEWLQYYEPIIHIFVAVSDEIGVNLKNLIPHRSNDILVRPYAVDTPSLLERAPRPIQQPIRLMYAGRIEDKQKRIYDLPVLIEELKKAQIDFYFRIVGEGSRKDWLLQQIEQLELATHQKVVVQDVIPQDQMSELWKGSDICILVSEYEGTSIAMLEAMAQGCVPVVTAVSGTARVINHGVNGLTTAVGNMKEMALHVQTLASDREQLQQMSFNAYDTIAKNFLFDDYILWFQELLDQVWTHPPRQWPSDRPLLAREEVGQAEPSNTLQRKLRKIRTFLRKAYRLLQV